MKRTYLFSTITLLGLSGCSGTPIEDQSEEARAEVEVQVEEDAKSLEQAADEAVKILEEEVADERPVRAQADGINTAEQ